jgi:hypothetical protein
MNVKVKLSCMNSCRLAVREFARIHASHLNAKGKIVKISIVDDESWWELQLSLAFHSSTLINFELHGSNIDESFCYTRGNIQSTLTQLLFSFDQGMRVEKTLMQTLASQLSSTLIQLLFSFDRGMKVEKTLMQTLASQLSSTLMQLLFSFDRDMRVEKTHMQTLASKLSSTLVVSCNSCSRLTGAWKLRKLSCKLSLLNSHVTLVLVWPGHGSWENSHANLKGLGISIKVTDSASLNPHPEILHEQNCQKSVLVPWLVERQRFYKIQHKAITGTDSIVESNGRKQR